jgi:hypothetical protein
MTAAMSKSDRTRFRLVLEGAPFDSNTPPVPEAVRGWRVSTQYLDISKDEMKIAPDWFLTGHNHRKVGDALLKDEVEGRLAWYLDIEGMSGLQRLQEQLAGVPLTVEFVTEAGPTIRVSGKR